VTPIPVDVLTRTRYADVEWLLTHWTRGALGALDLAVASEMPDAGELEQILEQRAGFVQIEAFGGPGERNPAQDTANVDVDVYVGGDTDGNPDRASASDLAELLRSAFLFHLPGYFTDTATVSGVATMSRPSARPYDDNATVRRFGASYQVTVKSH
jgi:hypothetical protein